MTTTIELRELCAQKLLAMADQAGQLTAFVGLDGFVDEILHVVDKRMDAQNYERAISRRGVLFTPEQAQRFVADTGKNRMWRYDWPPVQFNPERVIAGIKALGVDVTNWGA